MNQEKIGEFLKTLRKEKNITQEQLASDLGVSNRSVSRWENGINMPDLSLLLQIAEYYSIDVSEILYAEKKETHQTDSNAITQKIVDYSSHEKAFFTRQIRGLFITSLIFLLLNMLIEILNLVEKTSGWINRLVNFTSGFSIGFALASLFVGILYTTKYFQKLKKFKLKIIKKFTRK